MDILYAFRAITNKLAKPSTVENLAFNQTTSLLDIPINELEAN